MNSIDKAEAFFRAAEKHFGKGSREQKSGYGALPDLRKVIEEATRPKDYIPSWEAAAYADLDPKSLTRFDGELSPKVTYVSVPVKTTGKDKAVKKTHKVKQYHFGTLKAWVKQRAETAGKRVKGGRKTPQRATIEIYTVEDLRRTLRWLTIIDPGTGRRAIRSSILVTDLAPEEVKTMRVDTGLDVRVMAFSIHEALTEHTWTNPAMREGWQKFYLSVLADEMKAIKFAGANAAKARLEEILPPAAAKTCKHCGRFLAEGNHRRCGRL